MTTTLTNKNQNTIKQKHYHSISFCCESLILCVRVCVFCHTMTNINYSENETIYLFRNNKNKVLLFFFSTFFLNYNRSFFSWLNFYPTTFIRSSIFWSLCAFFWFIMLLAIRRKPAWRRSQQEYYTEYKSFVIKWSKIISKVTRV